MPALQLHSYPIALRHVGSSLARRQMDSADTNSNVNNNFTIIIGASAVGALVVLLSLFILFKRYRRSRAPPASDSEDETSAPPSYTARDRRRAELVAPPLPVYMECSDTDRVLQKAPLEDGSDPCMDRHHHEGMMEQPSPMPATMSSPAPPPMPSPPEAAHVESQ